MEFSSARLFFGLTSAKLNIMQRIFLKSSVYRKNRLNMNHYSFFNDKTLGTEIFDGTGINEQKQKKTPFYRHATSKFISDMRYNFN